MLQLKIPVTAYHPTLTALTKLGAQLSFNEQAEDVTQQVADVSSRVASAQAAIKQLRALLSRAGNIGALLSVQDEINSQETALEVPAGPAARPGARDQLRDRDGYVLVGHHAKIVHKPREEPPRAGRRPGTGWRGLKLVVVWLLTAIGTAAAVRGAGRG